MTRWLVVVVSAVAVAAAAAVVVDSPSAEQRIVSGPAPPGESGWVQVAWADAYATAAQRDIDRQVAEYLAAVEADRLARVEAERVAVIVARWTAVGRCEQPTGPGGAIQWDLVSSTYSGGLGISNAAWRQWGGGEFGPTAGHATPWQQMVVAERIREAVGRSAWGCPVP